MCAFGRTYNDNPSLPENPLFPTLDNSRTNQAVLIDPNCGVAQTAVVESESVCRMVAAKRSSPSASHHDGGQAKRFCHRMSDVAKPKSDGAKSKPGLGVRAVAGCHSSHQPLPNPNWHSQVEESRVRDRSLPGRNDTAETQAVQACDQLRAGADAGISVSGTEMRGSDDPHNARSQYLANRQCG